MMLAGVENSCCEKDLWCSEGSKFGNCCEVVDDEKNNKKLGRHREQYAKSDV